METKKEYKYQYSSKLDNGEIFVCRNDDKEELMLDVEWFRSHDRQEKAPETHPSVSDEGLNEEYQGKTLEEIPEIDESYCDIHDVKMFKKEGKYGVFYTHGRKKDDGTWENCNGKGFK